VQVHHDEGVANHIEPESCAAVREGSCEALTGECTGQPLSRESPLFLGADVVPLTERRDVIANAWTARRGRRHRHVRTLLACEPGDLAIDRLATAAGPCREGVEPYPMMYDREKTDLAIVATKPMNKAGQLAAESVEPRAGAEGDASQ